MFKGSSLPSPLSAYLCCMGNLEYQKEMYQKSGSGLDPLEGCKTFASKFGS